MYIQCFYVHAFYIIICPSINLHRSYVVVQWISADGSPQKVQCAESIRPKHGFSGTLLEGSNIDRGGSWDGHGEASLEWQLSVDSKPTKYGPDDLCGYPGDSVGWIDPGFM